MSKVACIIINYKNTDDTIDTLRSLCNLQNVGEVKFFVVDNASTPESSAALSAFDELPITTLSQSTNLGFAGAVNLAAEHAFANECDYLWLLNNDTFVESQTLLQMIETAQNHAVGIVGSLIFYYPERDTIWCAQGRLRRPWLIVEHRGKGRRERDYPIQEGPQEVSFVNGCSMLIRRKLFEEVGGMDASLFLYGEDVDFCIRAQNLGYKLLFQPQSRVWHKVSRATGGEFNQVREYYNSRNGFEMIKRYVRPLPVRCLAYYGRATWDIYRMSRSALRSHWSLREVLRLFMQAVRDFRSGRLGQYEQRGGRD